MITPDDAENLMETAMPEYAIGDKVRLLRPVWDDDTDQAYPPGYIGRAGDLLIVRKVNPPEFTWPLYVSHGHVTGNAFGVRFDEIEPAETP